MSNKAKKWIFIIVAVVLVLAIGIIVCLNYVFPKMLMEHLFPKEEFTESYDGKYGYLQLSSPKGVVCTINLYDRQAPPGGKAYIQTLHKFYRQWDMEEIMWGVQSYDLFFDIPEGGPYIYKFDSENERWVGPLYFDKNETKEKRLQGDNTSYCFTLDYTTNKEEFPEYDFFQPFVIEKDTIPKRFSKKLDFYLAR